MHSGHFLLLGGNNNMASKETMLKELGISEGFWELKTDGKSPKEVYEILKEIYENQINKEYEKLGKAAKDVGLPTSFVNMARKLAPLGPR